MENVTVARMRATYQSAVNPVAHQSNLDPAEPPRRRMAQIDEPSRTLALRGGGLVPFAAPLTRSSMIATSAANRVLALAGLMCPSRTA
jgi:hypothetical protein